MAHVGVVNVPPDEPSHRAPCDNIGCEVFLRCDSRCAHYAGQAVRSYADNSLALVLVIQQGGD
jgi:hypothetical protein